MKKITQLFVTFAFALVAVFSATTVAEVSVVGHHSQVEAASSTSGTIFGSKEVNSTAKNSEASKITNKIFTAANIFSGFVLAISIIMIIVGGLRYILSNGDQRQAESGKMILIYSGIGIVIALSAFVIARLFASFKF